MTTIVEKARAALRGPGGASPEAPRVEPKLRAAEHALAILEAEHGELALAEALGAPDAKSDLAAWRNRVVTQRDLVAGLRAAHQTAVAHDEEAHRVAVEKIHSMQRRAFKQHLAKRDDAARRLQEAIGALAEPWLSLIDASLAARQAFPLGFAFPNGGSYCDVGAIKGAVANELFRVLCGPLGPGNLSRPSTFPGAAPLTFASVAPEVIPPLRETIEKASSYLIDLAVGNAVAPPTAPSPAPVPASARIEEAQGRNPALAEEAAILAGSPTHGAEEIQAAIRPVKLS